MRPRNTRPHKCPRARRPLAGGFLGLGLLALGALPPGPARAQAPAARAPQQPAAQPSAAAAPDPVLARVDGVEIRLSEVREAGEQLPDEVRGAPPTVLYPLILDQLIAQKALVAAARAEHLERDPEVVRRVGRAEEQELQQAYLRREVALAVTDDALRRRFAAQAPAGGEEEVHARHILVTDEAEARVALAEARAPGADFADVARRRSTGPGAANGGDLGFFKRADMIPEFAAAAFALRPGEISAEPVRTPFGWHVIKVEERRAGAPRSFEEGREPLRQAAVEEAVAATVERVRAAAKVERFNLDGTPVRAAPGPGGATPPAATPPGAVSPAPPSAGPAAPLIEAVPPAPAPLPGRR